MDPRYSMTSINVPEPVMSLAIQPKTREGSANFSKAINRCVPRNMSLALCQYVLYTATEQLYLPFGGKYCVYIVESRMNLLPV